MRPSKVMANALSAALHRMTHRARSRPAARGGDQADTGLRAWATIVRAICSFSIVVEHHRLDRVGMPPASPPRTRSECQADPRPPFNGQTSLTLPPSVSSPTRDRGR